MTPAVFLREVLDPGLDWLERHTGLTRSREDARPVLLAIALQESECRHRAQLGLTPGRPGPARGWWQFEQGGGVAGVLTHRASAALARQACEAAWVAPEPAAVWRVLEGHDHLATAFARLLLLTDPHPVPTGPSAAWVCYADRLWRPGKPHPAKWQANWEAACDACGV
jgi:hypothetical protein